MTLNKTRGKKIFKCLLIFLTSTPQFLLVLLPKYAGHSRKNNLAL